ncbi:hypothetical protein ABTX82_14380 [Streptomyces lavendulae]|uniref:hypothetical protein n=1 Tax=Streptomyces lavendulae TaxID=1914 RepID=UPI00332D78BC
MRGVGTVLFLVVPARVQVLAALRRTNTTSATPPAGTSSAPWTWRRHGWTWRAEEDGTVSGAPGEAGLREVLAGTVLPQPAAPGDC